MALPKSASLREAWCFSESRVELEARAEMGGSLPASLPPHHSAVDRSLAIAELARVRRPIKDYILCLMAWRRLPELRTHKSLQARLSTRYPVLRVPSQLDNFVGRG